MAKTAVRVTVSGYVQGVGYRYSTQAEASRLGVTGWVRNDAGGTVSGHFEGDPDAVGALVDWCRRGPRSASVDDVAVRAVTPEGLTRFRVDG